MTLSPQIRLICAQDNPAVAELIRAVMAEFGAVGEGFSVQDPEVDHMFEAYQGPLERFWVVELGSDVLGCGGFAPLCGGPEDTCELRKMYFMPQLRGLGAGAQLMQLCLNEAASLGYRRMYLETIASMSKARVLYQRSGFHLLESPMGNTGHTACNSWMARSLSEG